MFETGTPTCGLTFADEDGISIWSGRWIGLPSIESSKGIRAGVPKVAVWNHHLGVTVEVCSSVGHTGCPCGEGHIGHGSDLTVATLVVDIAIERIPGDEAVGGNVGGDLCGAGDGPCEAGKEKCAFHGVSF